MPYSEITPAQWLCGVAVLLVVLLVTFWSMGRNK